MPSQPNPSRPALPAAVSTLVTALVDGPVVGATVVAGHRFALYLDVAGTVLPVVTSDAVPLPTALRLAVPAGSVEWGVAAGDVVPVGRRRVTLPSLDVVGARAWRPARVRPTPRGECGNGCQGDHVRTHGGRGAVLDLLAGAAGAGCDAWLLDTLDTLDAVDTLDTPGTPTTRHRGVGTAGVVRELIGRGRGLTPSGDDALAGVLLVAHAHGIHARRDPGHGIHSGLAGAVLARLDRTTAVSAALLASAADGYAAREVVTLVDAAVAGDPDAVARSLPAVLAIGHSSGHDLVAGLRAALSPVAPRHECGNGGPGNHFRTRGETIAGSRSTPTGRSAA